jgi:mannose-6-phosphate isomerase class I
MNVSSSIIFISSNLEINILSLINLTSFMLSYVVSKISHASLADSLFEILANSDGENA